ncbi:MAG: epimerase, partial [Acidobacteriota bacterium]
VLMESLMAPEIDQVIVLGRGPTGEAHPKLVELLVDDFEDLSGVADRLRDIDACFWCLGTSSSGMDEALYFRITHTYALSTAALLLEANPDLRFCFLSGAGADGSAMWAKVKSKTERDLRGLGLKQLTVLRPAYIRDRHGARLRGLTYQVTYQLFTLFSPLIRRFGGGTSNAEIGQAMIQAVLSNSVDSTLTSREINALAAEYDRRS